jgi:hypothetical protein
MDRQALQWNDGSNPVAADDRSPNTAGAKCAHLLSVRMNPKSEWTARISSTEIRFDLDGIVRNIFLGEEAMNSFCKILLASTTVWLAACSAALVPYTSDTTEKVRYALELMKVDRMLPAERMLREVHQTNAETSKQFVARGEAHVLYAVILGNGDWMTAGAFSQLVESLGGKANLPAAVKQHLGLAETDYSAAKTLLLQEKDNFGLSNIEWRLAGVYIRQGVLDKACKALDESLRHNENATQANPDMKVDMRGVKGDYSSYSEMIAAQKKMMACS